MNNSTAARFAQLLAAATPAAKPAAALPAPPPDAPKVQTPVIVPAVIPPAATAPKLPKIGMKEFQILWHEGTGDMFDGYKATTWQEAQYIMTMIKGSDDSSGYQKSKIKMTFADGYTTEQRVYLSKSTGDFHPERETIGDYLKEQAAGLNMMQKYSFEDLPGTPEFTPPAPQQAEPEATKEPAEIDLMPEYVSALFDKFKEGDTVKYIGAQATATIESFEYEHTLPTAKIVWNDTGKSTLAYLDSLEKVDTPKKARCIPMQFNFTTPTTTGSKGKKLSIETYTDKSFVVRGEETKKYSDQLFKLSGKYNHYLKGGPGWIFSNKHLKDVQKFVGQ